MTLDELQKICDEATPWPRPLNHSGICLDVNDADLSFIDAARACLPRLVAVAKAAKEATERLDSADNGWVLDDVRDALASLESADPND